mgnify:FL=1
MLAERAALPSQTEHPLKRLHLTRQPTPMECQASRVTPIVRSRQGLAFNASPLTASFPPTDPLIPTVPVWSNPHCKEVNMV